MDTRSRLTIEALGKHPDLVELTVDWHIPEFDPQGDRDFWLRARSDEARLGGVPCAWVAFMDEVPIGSVSLIECNMDTHPELTPWLAALFVLPEHRSRGVGQALVRRCEQEAASLGFTTMYLYASVARDYYPRFGWTPIADDVYEGESVTIMRQDLSPQ